MILMRPFVAAMAAIGFFAPWAPEGTEFTPPMAERQRRWSWLHLRRGSFLYRVRNEVADWKYQRNRKRFQHLI